MTDRAMPIIVGMPSGGTTATALMLQAAGYTMATNLKQRLVECREYERLIKSAWGHLKPAPHGDMDEARRQLLGYVLKRLDTEVRPAVKHPFLPLLWDSSMKAWPVKWIMVHRPRLHVEASWARRWPNWFCNEHRPAFLDAIADGLKRMRKDLGTNRLALDYYGLLGEPETGAAVMCNWVGVEPTQERLRAMAAPVERYEPAVCYTGTAIDYELIYERLAQCGYQSDPYQHHGIKSGFLAWLLERCSPKSALEVGAANGAAVEYLSGKGIEAEGIEVSPTLVKQAEVYRRQVVEGDARELPHEDNAFDLVWSSDTMEHLAYDHVDQAIAEQVRVSRRWVAHKIATRLDQNKRWQRIAKQNLHMSVMTIEQWIERFEAAGCRLVAKENNQILMEVTK